MMAPNVFPFLRIQACAGFFRHAMMAASIAMAMMLAGCATKPNGAGGSVDVAEKRQGSSPLDGAAVAEWTRIPVVVEARFVEVRDRGAISQNELSALTTADGRGGGGAVLSVLSPEAAARVWKGLATARGVEVFSAPRVTVVAGSQATITVGEQMSYPARWGMAANGLRPGELVTRTIGVELAAKPEIEADGWLRLEVKPTLAEFDGFLELGALAPDVAKDALITLNGKPMPDAGLNALAPVFSVRELEATVRLRPGETVVLRCPAKKRVEGGVVRDGGAGTATGAEVATAKTGEAAETFVLVTASLERATAARCPRISSQCSRINWLPVWLQRSIAPTKKALR